ncbi:MAG: hypothetical protein ACFB4I_16060 [Cyanophyceae cyanobacterium]
MTRPQVFRTAAARKFKAGWKKSGFSKLTNNDFGPMEIVDLTDKGRLYFCSRDFDEPLFLPK